jgi:hypothetical protein
MQKTTAGQHQYFEPDSERSNQETVGPASSGNPTTPEVGSIATSRPIFFRSASTSSTTSQSMVELEDENP